MKKDVGVTVWPSSAATIQNTTRVRAREFMYMCWHYTSGYDPRLIEFGL